MTDLYLMTDTEAEMIAALTSTGVIDDEGFPIAGILLDHIGPFSRTIDYDNAGEPILADYPDWHTNLRGNFTDEQLAALELLSVQPVVPYRVWA
jgi:hypothetical protein